jgi:hypothetical protein
VAGKVDLGPSSLSQKSTGMKPSKKKIPEKMPKKNGKDSMPQNFQKFLIKIFKSMLINYYGIQRKS